MGLFFVKHYMMLTQFVSKIPTILFMTMTALLNTFIVRNLSILNNKDSSVSNYFIKHNCGNTCLSTWASLTALDVCKLGPPYYYEVRIPVHERWFCASSEFCIIKKDCIFLSAER